MCLEPEDMDSETQLRVGKVLGTKQCLSKRIVPCFEFNLKFHHLKNNLKYLEFDFKKNDMHVNVKWHETKVKSILG